MIELKSERQLDSMRQACRIVNLVLEELKKRVVPGISTIELDKISAELIESYGGMPAFKGYRGFPANICTSINEAIVHGIPSKRILNDGDIISLDIGVKFDGYFGDAAVTLGVGNISQAAKKLIDITSEALLVRSKVFWFDGAETKEFILEETLYNWKL